MRWLEAELPGAAAAFSTQARRGQRAALRHASTSGALTGDPGVRENRHRLAAALEIDPRGVLIGRQVHEALVLRHDEPTRAERVRRARRPGLPRPTARRPRRAGLAPLVFVADCLPVALAGAARRGDDPLRLARAWPPGSSSAGWRRSRPRPPPSARASAPAATRSASEVLAAFRPLGRGLASGRMLDLREVARRLLERAGVERGRDQRPLHELPPRALLLAPARPGPHGAPGGSRLAVERSGPAREPASGRSAKPDADAPEDVAE